MNTKKLLVLSLLFALAGLLSSCRIVIGNLDKIFPIKIGAASISNIKIEPATLPSGVSQQVTVSFTYNHEDGDLGLKGKVIVKLSGATLIEQNVELNKTSDTVRVPVTVSTPNTETTLSLEVLVAVGDQMSTSLPATLHVAADDDRDGVGNSEDACPKDAGGPANGGCPVPPANDPGCIWFVDGWTPPIKQVRFIRVGRQVFAMVNEPDENISTDTPDFVFAWIMVPHTGDLEVFQLTEIGGTNTGIFAGLGPLLVQRLTPAIQRDGELSVWDGDTMLMYYGDVNNLSQQCMAQARAGLGD